MSEVIFPTGKRARLSSPPRELQENVPRTIGILRDKKKNTLHIPKPQSCLCLQPGFLHECDGVGMFKYCYSDIGACLVPRRLSFFERQERAKPVARASRSPLLRSKRLRRRQYRRHSCKMSLKWTLKYQAVVEPLYYESRKRPYCEAIATWENCTNCRKSALTLCFVSFSNGLEYKTVLVQIHGWGLYHVRHHLLLKQNN